MKSANLLRIVVTLVFALAVPVVVPTYAQSNSWSSGAPMLTPRFGAAFGVITGKVYVVSGATASAVVNTNEVYNPATNTWKTAAPIPTARYVVRRCGC